MADIGQDIVGTGANMVVGRGINAMAGRAFPIPSIYNPNDPNHWGNSEAMQILHGNPNAMRHFAGRTAGAIAGQALIPIPYIGGMVGGWLGNKFAGLFDSRADQQAQPTGTVGGSPATTTPTSATSGDTSIDPWTGQSLSSGSAGTQQPWIGNEAFSNYGPYASGYQAPTQAGPSSLSDPGANMPDFSNYGNPDQFIPQGAPMNHAERQDYRDNLGNNGAGMSGNYGVSNFNVGGSPVIFGDNGMDPNGRAVYNWGLPGN